MRADVQALPRKVCGCYYAETCEILRTKIVACCAPFAVVLRASIEYGVLCVENLFVMRRDLFCSVRNLSEEYWNTLRRRNYVTPTSYLELILTFKSLLGVKRDEVKTLQDRYLNGLEKLNFAASQVTQLLFSLWRHRLSKFTTDRFLRLIFKLRDHLVFKQNHLSLGTLKPFKCLHVCCYDELWTFELCFVLSLLKCIYVKCLFF